MLWNVGSASMKQWLFYFAVPILLILNYIIFQNFGFDYPKLYLEYGAKVSAVLLFGSFALDTIPHGTGLLSKNVASYSRAVLHSASIVLTSFGDFMFKTGDVKIRRASSIWDSIILILIITPLLLVILALWVLVISPANYLTTLVAGVPVRSLPLIISVYPNIAQTNPLLSKPFAFTQAVATVLLLLAEKIYENYSGG